MILEGIAEEYRDPKIIYMDTNCDVSRVMYNKFERIVGKKGWKVIKSEE